MRKIIYLAVITVVSFALVQSCKKSSTDSAGGTNNTATGFDRRGMLTNISTNIITPAYTSYQNLIVTLDAAVTTFTTTPNAGTLAAAQTAFTAAYKQWQIVGTFELGPAEDLQLRVNTNTYPADIAQITANIAGTYNPALLANLAAKGFPALDYLLFSGTDAAGNIALYTSDANAAKRKAYLIALSAEMKTNANTVVNAWTAYKPNFIAADGTDVSSATGHVLNQLVYDYEILKNFEIGIPAGVQSAGTTFPTKVQGYNAKISVQLALAHVQALQNLYLGGSGLGFDDYLISANAKKNGASLDDAIKAQFTVAIAKLQTLSDPLSTNITTNNTAVVAAYTELQKLTVMLKTDMTSSLGILITYGDNDGD